MSNRTGYLEFFIIHLCIKAVIMSSCLMETTDFKSKIKQTKKYEEKIIVRAKDFCYNDLMWNKNSNW